MVATVVNQLTGTVSYQNLLTGDPDLTCKLRLEDFETDADKSGRKHVLLDGEVILKDNIFWHIVPGVPNEKVYRKFICETKGTSARRGTLVVDTGARRGSDNPAASSSDTKCEGCFEPCHL